MSESVERNFPGRLAVYSFSHFCVDLACGCLVTSRMWPSPDGFLAVILYNFFAFAGQMPIGIMADKLNRNALMASIGCLLVICGIVVGVLPDAVLAAAMIAGVGNAMFHMGGGIDVLNVSGSKSGPLGIFVSPGALGLFIGVLYGQIGQYVMSIPIGLMVLCAVGIFCFQRISNHSMLSHNVPLSFKLTYNRSKVYAFCAIATLFAVVVIRSYVGVTLSFDWKSEGYWAVILVLSLVAGKMFGGLLSDKFGMRKIACITLALAAILYMFPDNPYAGVGAVLCFNMTMPMTLWALGRIFNQARGFAFGTLTCALFVGFAVTIFHPEPILPMGWGFMLATLLSIVLLMAGLGAVPNAEKLETKENDA